MHRGAAAAAARRRPRRPRRRRARAGPDRRPGRRGTPRSDTDGGRGAQRRLPALRRPRRAPRRGLRGGDARARRPHGRRRRPRARQARRSRRGPRAGWARSARRTWSSPARNRGCSPPRSPCRSSTPTALRTTGPGRTARPWVISAPCSTNWSTPGVLQPAAPRRHRVPHLVRGARAGRTHRARAAARRPRCHPPAPRGAHPHLHRRGPGMSRHAPAGPAQEMPLAAARDGATGPAERPSPPPLRCVMLDSRTVVSRAGMRVQTR